MKEITINLAEQRVLVLPFIDKEEVTKTGIIIPKGVEQDKPGMGFIVGVGKGSKNYPMMYRIGQSVIYSSYSGVDVKLNIIDRGEHVYKIMNQLDIMAMISP